MEDRAEAGRKGGEGGLTRWFVLRLSICFLKTSIQRSLHRNLITSSVSVNRGRSLLNLPSQIYQLLLSLAFKLKFGRGKEGGKG